MTRERVSIDLQLGRRSIELALANVEAGQRPFGAVIACGDAIVAEAVNTAAEDLDPTAHAEMRAVRAATVLRGSESLARCVIYASCEPCVMCASAIRWSRISCVRYCVTRETAQTYGFADVVMPSVSRTLLGGVDVRHLSELETYGQQPFERWRTARGAAPAFRRSS